MLFFIISFFHYLTEIVENETLILENAYLFHFSSDTSFNLKQKNKISKLLSKSNFSLNVR